MSSLPSAGWALRQGSRARGPGSRVWSSPGPGPWTLGPW